jgi:uncharacterized membrane protein affecting hemolysin expression
MGPIKRFRTKFRASRVTLPAAAIATALCAACLFAIWFERPDGQAEMDRYGSALATTLADTTAAALFEERRITLTVIANRLTALNEVAGFAFFDQSDELMAMSGVQRSDTSFDAQATIDDTRSGFCASHPESRGLRPTNTMGTVAIVVADRSVHAAL